MVRILTIREVIESDLRAECPFLPNEGEFEVYFSSLYQGIGALECVDTIDVVGNSIHINVSDDVEFETLREDIKPFLQGDTFEKLRVISFT